MKQTYTHEEDQMRSTVTKQSDGKYSVTLTDLDSGNTIPTTYTFGGLNAKKRANDKAKEIVGLKALEGPTTLGGLFDACIK